MLLNKLNIWNLLSQITPHNQRNQHNIQDTHKTGRWHKIETHISGILHTPHMAASQKLHLQSELLTNTRHNNQNNNNNNDKFK